MDRYSSELYGEDLLRVIKQWGIITISNHVIWLEYSCSGIEIEFQGKEISIEIISDLQNPNYAWIELYVYKADEVDRKSYIIDKKSQWIILKGLKYDKRIRISIFKRTEKKYGNIGVGKVGFNGKIIRGNDDNKKMIEFVGDSITCGYGAEKYSIFHKFSTKYENGLKAFPYLLCNLLQTDYEIIAYSGIGVWRSHRNFQWGTAQERYEHEYGRKTANNKKEFIIVNLGTNDSKNVHGIKDIISFENSYENLISCIRKYNPDSCIICTIGPMKCCLIKSIKKIYFKFRENGDNKVFFLEFQKNLFEGIGEGRHPTYFSQQRIANQLYCFCKDEIGWNY